MDELRRIELERDDVCSRCLLVMRAGTIGFGSAGGVICEQCRSERPRAGASAAGASARREYEIRRRLREQRSRESFGRIGGWWARNTRGPQTEQAWAIGAAGEARNARRIEQLVQKYPVRLLHDRHMPGTRSANIDHIGVGPGGVVVFDSKNVSGKVKVDWHGGLFSKREWDLYVGGRKRTHWIEGVERQLAAVQAALAGAGFRDIPALGALCMANGEGMPVIGQMRVRSVIVGRPRHVARLLVRKGRVPEHLIDPIATTLVDTFPPA